MTGRAAAFVTGLAAALLLCLCAPVAAQGAQPNEEALAEAGKHFQRGVTLYSETDYRGALVEFKRTAALIPNPAVLYNIAYNPDQQSDRSHSIFTGTLTVNQRGDFAYLGGS